MESLARNHTLIDGNKILALAAVIAFLGMNGLRIGATNDEVYDVTMDAATGTVVDVPAIAGRLAQMTVPR